MGGYKTVVVGTDGSDSSLRAVDRAGQYDSGAGGIGGQGWGLVVACLIAITACSAGATPR